MISPSSGLRPQGSDYRHSGKPSKAVLVTRREAEILDLLVAGQSNLEIGKDLYISYKTVDSHIGSLMRKTGLAGLGHRSTRRVRLAMWWVKRIAVLALLLLLPYSVLSEDSIEFVEIPTNLSSLLAQWPGQKWSVAPMDFKMNGKPCLIVSSHDQSKGSKVYCRESDMMSWYDATTSTGYTSPQLPFGDNRPDTNIDFGGSPLTDLGSHSFSARLSGSFERLGPNPPWLQLRTNWNFQYRQWFDWSGDWDGDGDVDYGQHFPKVATVGRDGSISPATPWGEIRLSLRSGSSYVSSVVALSPPANMPASTVARMVAAKTSCSGFFARVLNRNLNVGGGYLVLGSAEYEGQTNQNCFVSAAVLCVSGTCTDMTAAWGLPLIGTPIHQLDVDGDGDQDLIVANGPSPGVYLWTGSGYGLVPDPSSFMQVDSIYLSMWPKTGILPGGHFWSTAWDGYTGLWWNNGDGTYTPKVGPYSAWRSDGVGIPFMDMSGDGGMYFVCGGCNGGDNDLRIYHKI